MYFIYYIFSSCLIPGIGRASFLQECKREFHTLRLWYSLGHHSLSSFWWILPHPQVTLATWFLLDRNFHKVQSYPERSALLIQNPPSSQGQLYLLSLIPCHLKGGSCFHICENELKHPFHETASNIFFSYGNANWRYISGEICKQTASPKPMISAPARICSCAKSIDISKQNSSNSITQSGWSIKSVNIALVPWRLEASANGPSTQSPVFLLFNREKWFVYCYRTENPATLQRSLKQHSDSGGRYLSFQ